MGRGKDDVIRTEMNKICWPGKGLWALALAGLLYLTGLTVWLGVTGLAFPYQLDYGEGLLLHFVREWSQGRPIYRPIGEYPLITANYPPLDLLLPLALTPLFGIRYIAGRVWTLLAIAVVAALIAAWVRQESGRRLPAVAAALLFVGSPYVYHWAPLFRVDLVGLALTLGGLYAAWRGMPSFRPAQDRPDERGKGKGGLLGLAVVLFVAALYTKQSFLFAPAAALAWLFLAGHRRQAALMAVAMAGLGGGLFLLINALTHGGFWQGLVVSNVNPFVWPEFWKQLGNFFGTFAVLALLAAWYAADRFLLDRATPLRQKVTPLDLYLIASLCSLGLAGKAGAWENYFFEALAALALCAGLGLASLGRLPSPLSRIRPLLPPLLLLVQVALMWHTPRLADRYLRLTRQSNEAMAPLLAAAPDPIASEDMGLLVTNGKALDYCSFQYSQLARAGRWDQSWELGRLQNRRWTLVILEQGTRLDVDHYRRFTRQFLSELDRNYRLSRTVGKYELYEPDPLQQERWAGFADRLALVGWSLHAPPQDRTRGLFSLTVVWQAQQKLATDYAAFAHLVDEAGRGWAGDDHQPHGGLYPTSRWGAHEMVRDTFTLTVPADAPPGLYTVELGWYLPETQERLPVGEGNTVRVAVLPVGQKAIGPQTMTPLAVPFGPAITLEGYTWQVEPGVLRVTLRWSAGGYPDADYTVFVHLVAPEEADRIVSQGDAPPLGGRWPTSLWRPGVVLDDTHLVPLPPDLPPGTYHLLVGLYDPATGRRLPLPDGRDAVRLQVKGP